MNQEMEIKDYTSFDPEHEDERWFAIRDNEGRLFEGFLQYKGK